MNHKEKSKQALQNLGGLVKKHNIGQSVFAEKFEIRQGTVSDMLRGKFNPTLDIIVKYLDLINELTGENYSLKDIDFVLFDSEVF